MGTTGTSKARRGFKQKAKGAEARVAAGLPPLHFAAPSLVTDNSPAASTSSSITFPPPTQRSDVIEERKQELYLLKLETEIEVQREKKYLAWMRADEVAAQWQEATRRRKEEQAALEAPVKRYKTSVNAENKDAPDNDEPSAQTAVGLAASEDGGQRKVHTAAQKAGMVSPDSAPVPDEHAQAKDEDVTMSSNQQNATTTKDDMDEA